MRWKSVVAITLCSLLCVAHHAHSLAMPETEVPTAGTVTVQTSTQLYRVNGTTFATLLQQLNALGPVTSSGRHHAYTNWNVQWRYPFARTPNGCWTGPVTIIVSVRYTLPAWVPEEEPEAGLHARWNRYESALHMHEAGHRDLGVRAANAIAAALPRVAPQPSCEALDAEANAVGNRILQTFLALEVRYDNETQHGRTQGAWFR